MTAEHLSSSDALLLSNAGLPFYSPSRSLRRLANQWNVEQNLQLIPHRYEDSFIQQVQQQHPPVVAFGAVHSLLSARIIAQVAATKIRPIIVALVETIDEATMIACFQQGADRVVAAPQCSAQIFRALIKALHSRDIHYPPYHFDPAIQTCNVGNRAVRLTAKRFDIAQYLFANQGKLISKPVILKDIWGLEGDECETRRLEVHMSYVRRQLSLDGSLGWEIRSRRKMGYGIFQTVDSAN